MKSFEKIRTSLKKIKEMLNEGIPKVKIAFVLAISKDSLNKHV